MADNRGRADKRGAGIEGVSVKRVCPVCNTTYPAELLVCPDDGSGLLEIPDAPLLTGRRLDDRYDIGGVVGTGGMGVVYRAHQRGMERDVAIKVLHPQYAHDPRAVKRFFREAQAASRLVHRNVVSVYDFGRSADENIYLVMELLDGWTLGDLIHNRAPLTPATAVEIAAQVCAALEAAHARRVVHRDLKPDNVQLVTRDGFVIAKVLDFGIARVMRDPEANLGVHLSTVDIAGTPAYMSPEQIMGKDPDPRSDLYSLGVILYEMLTGVRPFVDDNSVTLCMKQLNEEPPLMEEHLGEAVVPADVAAIVYQLLAKDVDRRPESAAMVRSQLLSTGVSHDHHLARVSMGEIHPSGTSSLPTRADLGPLMRSSTEISRLGNVQAQADHAADESPHGGVACSSCGASCSEGLTSCPRCGETLAGGVRAPRERSVSARAREQGEPVVAAALMVPDEADLEAEAISRWLDVRAEEGWDVTRRHAVAVLRIPRSLGLDPGAALRLLVERTRGLIGSTEVPLRLGSMTVERGQGPEYEDLVRRLAAAAGHGEVCVTTGDATTAGLVGHTVASVFDARGNGVPCVAVGREKAPRSTLVGRERELRRMERALEATRRQGAGSLELAGERGSGRTALLQAFCAQASSLYLRVAPGAAGWPGHTAARVALACLGLSDAASDDAIRARIEPLSTHLRERLTALLLDEESVEGVGDTGLVYALLELLDWRAGAAPFVLAIDDLEFLDAASRVLLEEVISAASSRSWLVVTAIDRGSKNGLSVDTTRLELRSLGLRAATEIVRTGQVAAARHRAVLSAAQGNPLALHLLKDWSGEGDLPRPGNTVRSLLPGRLRGCAAKVAEAAWLGAASGRVESEDDTIVRAARLYLSVGLSDSLRRWLDGRLKGQEGLARHLAVEVDMERPAALLRAERCGRLGLWQLAAREAATVAPPPGRRGLDMRLRVGVWLARAGQLGDATKHANALLQRGTSTIPDPPLVELAGLLLEAGSLAEAEELLRRVVRKKATGRPSIAVATARALLARCAVRKNAPVDAMSELSLARELLERSHERDLMEGRALEALLQEVRAEIALTEGDLRTTRTNLRQARDTFRDLERPADAIRCLNDLGRIELDDGEAQRAVDTFRAAVGLASTAGLRMEQRRARVGLGEALVHVGCADEAANILRRVLRESRVGREDRRTLGSASVAMARVMLTRGLARDAERYVELALSHRPNGPTAARAQLVCADAHLAVGQIRLAKRALAEAASLAARSGQMALRTYAEERLEVLEPTGDESPRVERLATGQGL